MAGWERAQIDSYNTYWFYFELICDHIWYIHKLPTIYSCYIRPPTIYSLYIPIICGFISISELAFSLPVPTINFEDHTSHLASRLSSMERDAKAAVVNVRGKNIWQTKNRWQQLLIFPDCCFFARPCFNLQFFGVEDFWKYHMALSSVDCSEALFTPMMWGTTGVLTTHDPGTPDPDWWIRAGRWKWSVCFKDILMLKPLVFWRLFFFRNHWMMCICWQLKYLLRSLELCILFFYTSFGWILMSKQQHESERRNFWTEHVENKIDIWWTHNPSLFYRSSVSVWQISTFSFCPWMKEMGFHLKRSVNCGYVHDIPNKWILYWRSSTRCLFALNVSKDIDFKMIEITYPFWTCDLDVMFVELLSCWQLRWSWWPVQRVLYLLDV